MTKNVLKIGKYKHFKRHLCNVLGIAKYSEDPEKEFVVYDHVDEDGKSQPYARSKENVFRKCGR